MTRVEWTESDVADLETIPDSSVRDSADYADALVERLILSVDQLESFLRGITQKSASKTTVVGVDNA